MTLNERLLPRPTEAEIDDVERRIVRWLRAEARPRDTWWRAILRWWRE